MQQHRYIESKSINAINLLHFVVNSKGNLHKQKIITYCCNLNENLKKWSRNTIPIVGKFMMSSTEDTRISKRDRELKVKYFLGAAIDDVYNYIKLLLKKFSGNTILHILKNNMGNELSTVILGKLLVLKKLLKRLHQKVTLASLA